MRSIVAARLSARRPAAARTRSIVAARLSAG